MANAAVIATRKGPRAIQLYKRVKEPFNQRIVSQLPPAYQKFFREWVDQSDNATPVHWIPKEEKWSRNPETGEVKPVQNIPIPVMYPNEIHQGIWGGEGVVEGLVKKGKYRSPVPKFWAPNLKKTVVYSEILDLYLSVVVTDRALQLIDQNAGLDSYLLKTPAYDLQSLLALKLKRALLLTLVDRTFPFSDTQKQNQLLEKYKEYLMPRDEADWYGLSVNEAKAKYDAIARAKNKPVPLKHKLRQDLLLQIEEEKNSPDVIEEATEPEKRSWVSKMNPFSKPANAP